MFLDCKNYFSGLPLILSFEIKGVTGGEKVIINDAEGNVLEVLNITKDWQKVFYTLPSQQEITLNVSNEGSEGIILNNAETLRISYLEKLAEWNCGSQTEHALCQLLREARLQWNGNYSITKLNFSGTFNLICII